MSNRRKFLVVADDTAEFQAALRFACRRARSTGGYVALLKVIEPAVFEHWSGVRDEIARQQRQEAEASLQQTAEYVQAETGLAPEFLIKEADSTRAALKQVLSDDPDIKVMVLAAAVGGRGPGPLVAAIAKDGVKFGSRKVPITIVPGDLTDEEITDLA
ncbi:MAG: universal stress protein [Phenylobacterium sp.]|jgi:nucleotide-binding universal stress UspA family protein|uniref:universal stress protein n=1 Tax=unclassified Phenylobacterium TaxID=2640670 RepID=UPI0008D17FDE|nr:MULTISPECIES: universal stress protein [unclassified Phenylobacterium]MBJ7411733.1 universal stress protein [Phenylobacterium sp.]OHB29704.1 MAG: universal stress protein UspA [Phenylobacterium sp. RIFCSPHIGHO2_01_FULL_69_31]